MGSGDREAPRETFCMFEPGNSGTISKYQTQDLSLFSQLLTKGLWDVSLWCGLVSECSKMQKWGKSGSGWMPKEGCFM